MDEIITRMIDMPTEMKGMTVLDDNGDYNIYINARFSSEAQREIYKHEIKHITKEDFYNSRSIREKEDIQE